MSRSGATPGACAVESASHRITGLRVPNEISLVYLRDSNSDAEEGSFHRQPIYLINGKGCRVPPETTGDALLIPEANQEQYRASSARTALVNGRSQIHGVCRRGHVQVNPPITGACDEGRFITESTII